MSRTRPLLSLTSCFYCLGCMSNLLAQGKADTPSCSTQALCCYYCYITKILLLIWTISNCLYAAFSLHHETISQGHITFSSLLLVQINNDRERQHCALQSFRLPMFAQLHRMPIVHYTNLIALDVPFISLLSPHASSLNSCHIQLEPNF